MEPPRNEEDFINENITRIQGAKNPQKEAYMQEKGKP